MSKILKSYRFYEGTLDNLEFIAKARKELGQYELNQTSIIEILIWEETERLKKELKLESIFNKKWEP